MDPEKYVDTGYALCQLNSDDTLAKEEEQTKIWTHINANVCQNLIHVEQHWLWPKTNRCDPRRYSFLGLYRKHSEAAIQELIRLKNCLKQQKAVRHVEQTALFASFQGETIFSICFKQVKVLDQIIQQLADDESEKEYDDDQNELEQIIYRRIFYQLARHTIENRLSTSYVSMFRRSVKNPRKTMRQSFRKQPQFSFKSFPTLFSIPESTYGSQVSIKDSDKEQEKE